MELTNRDASRLKSRNAAVAATTTCSLPLLKRRPPAAPGPVAQAKAVALQATIDRLKLEKRDLEIALLTSNEHNDYLQDHLYRIGTSLAAEVRERQIVEGKLQQVLREVTQQNVDLEILVQILIDKGDESAEEGAKARIDGLTQIANRRRFDEYLSQEWVRHRRAQRAISLLICDVDHFKLFNDTYGHQAGDDCLRTVANALRQCLRRNGDMVARYGGEEFAMVLPETNFQGAVQVANQVRSALALAGVPHAGSPVCDTVTLSIGVACTIPQTKAGADPGELVAEADRFLYLAKHRGRNRVGHQD